jgi:tetratricopeptide (TPR) repeat protein
VSKIGKAVRLHELALRERMAGRPADALPACLDALAILEPELGRSSPDVANVLNTLEAIREDLSEYGEAEACYRRAAAILDGIEGDDEVLVRVRVRTLASLAGIERVQGRLDEAERLFLEALGLAEAAFDPDGPELAPLLNNLAMVYKYAARFDEAEALYRRALAAVEASLGPEHPEAAAIWHNLGGIEHARGRHAEGSRSPAARSRSARPRWAPTIRR